MITRTKGQMKMMETLLILVIFLFLLGIVFILYVKLSRVSAEQSRSEDADLQSIEIAQTVAFLAELQCSAKNVAEDNCFDLLKINALSDLILRDPLIRNRYYYDLFEYSNITIQEIYPTERSFTLYDRHSEACEDGGGCSSKLTLIPTTIYDPYSKRYSFAVLSIRTTR